MPDAAYWREYRKRRAAQGRPVDAGRDRRRAVRAPEDRSREYARRPSRAQASSEPLPLLYPELQHGARLSFWEDELRIDLAQVAARFKATGAWGSRVQRSVDEYRKRETQEHMLFVRLDLLPLDIVETAQPIEPDGRYSQPKGDGLAAARCGHDKASATNGLCKACDNWARYTRKLLESGRITEEQARERAAERARAIADA